MRKGGWVIGIGPIDDFGMGPKVLLFKKEFYFSLSFRVRPLYIRFKWWPTRRSLVNDIHTMYAEGSAIQCMETFEYGQLYPDRVPVSERKTD